MKRFYTFLFACALMVVSPAWGDDAKPKYSIPTVSIEGAAEVVPYGEMVQLQIKTDKEPENVVATKYDWKIFESGKGEKRVFVTSDRETVLFAAGIKPTKFLVVLDVAYTFVTKDDKGVITDVQTLTTGILKTEVKVGGDYPVPVPPGPGPGPNPPTPLPLPDSPLGLVKPSVDAFNAMIAPSKVAVAKALAASYSLIKNKIAAGELITVDEIYKQLKLGNQKALADNAANMAEWQSYDDQIKRLVYQLYLDKKLEQVTNYIEVFSEIANSLNYVAGQK